MKLAIRPYQPDDADAIHQLFHASVQQLTTAEYSQAQRNAWAPEQLDLHFWQQRLAETQPMVAVVSDKGEEKVAGFAELISNDAYIDCVYVHPDCAGQGVGRALLNHLLALARVDRLRQLEVDVSLTAMRLFEKVGFKKVRENHIERNGVTLTNWRMQFTGL